MSIRCFCICSLVDRGVSILLYSLGCFFGTFFFSYTSIIYLSKKKKKRVLGIGF